MNKLESRTHKLLKEYGLVHTVCKPTRIGISHDIYGLWDHIFIPLKFTSIVDSSGRSYEFRELSFIQTKSRKLYGKALEVYKLFPYRYKYIFVWKKESNGRYSLFINNLGENNES